MRTLLLALGAAALAASAHAGTVTADFEGLTSTFIVQPSVTSQGYNFTASGGSTLAVIANGGPSICSPLCSDDGTAVLIFGTPPGTGINPPSVDPLTISGAQPFTLAAFDYAELQPTGSGVNATFLRVTGNLTIGGTLTRIVSLDGINDGPGGVADFQTVVFDSAFGTADFTSVTITGMANADHVGGFELDNVVLTGERGGGGVPEPAGWALMIVGFGGAGAALRQRRRLAAA